MSAAEKYVAAAYGVIFLFVLAWVVIIAAKLARLERETATNDRLLLWIAFDYGGRAELVSAARRLAEEGVAAEDVDEAALTARLHAPEVSECPPSGRPLLVRAVWVGSAGMRVVSRAA